MTNQKIHDTKYNLLVQDFITAMQKVMEFGAEKHGAWDWKERDNTYINDRMRAILSHYSKIVAGEWVDESGQTHLAHIAANAMIIDELAKQQK